jgi:hypothetical protein
MIREFVEFVTAPKFFAPLGAGVFAGGLTGFLVGLGTDALWTTTAAGGAAVILGMLAIVIVDEMGVQAGWWHG